MNLQRPFLTIVLLLLAGLAYAGEEDGAILILRKTGKEIKLATGMTEEGVEKDINVLLSVLPNLVSENKKKNALGVAATVDLTATAWKRLRAVPGEPALKVTLKDTKPITKDRFLATTSLFGYLTVTSEPKNAKVTVRSIEWGETEVGKWEEEGMHRIVIEKDGFKSHVGVVNIQRGRKNMYFKKLESE